MKGTEYQKKLEQLAKSRPSPGCHSATNAFRHLSIAWKIKDIDSDMAYFRGGCAEEEAATAIFHSLKRLKYPGAEKLNHHRHHHKLAAIPFLWAVNTSLTQIHQAGFEPQVKITNEDGNDTVSVSFRIPGTDKIAIPVPPLHFFSTIPLFCLRDNAQYFTQFCFLMGNNSPYYQICTSQRAFYSSFLLISNQRFDDFKSYNSTSKIWLGSSNWHLMSNRSSSLPHSVRRSSILAPSVIDLL